MTTLKVHYQVAYGIACGTRAKTPSTTTTPDAVDCGTCLKFIEREASDGPSSDDCLSAEDLSEFYPTTPATRVTIEGLPRKRRSGVRYHKPRQYRRGDLGAPTRKYRRQGTKARKHKGSEHNIFTKVHVRVGTRAA